MVAVTDRAGPGASGFCGSRPTTYTRIRVYTRVLYNLLGVFRSLPRRRGPAARRIVSPLVPPSRLLRRLRPASRRYVVVSQCIVIHAEMVVESVDYFPDTPPLRCSDRETLCGTMIAGKGSSAERTGPRRTLGTACGWLRENDGNYTQRSQKQREKRYFSRLHTSPNRV